MKAIFHRLIPFTAMAVGLAVFAVPDQAEAGIRVTLSIDGSADGLGTDVVLSNDGDFLNDGASIDGYTIVLETILTNHPGNSVTNQGTLVTTTTFSTDSAGAVSDLIILAEVVDDGALDTLSLFDYPTGIDFLVTTNLDSVGGTADGAVADAMTTVNGVDVATDQIEINGLDESVNSAIVSGTGPQYTLTNLTTISGVGNNADSVAISVRSTVAAVPEPGTVAMAIAGAPLFGLYWARRRRARA